MSGTPTASPVMGIFEIISAPAAACSRFDAIAARAHRSGPPDLYVGVDAKEFNLRLMPRLKAQAFVLCSTSARRCGHGARAGCARSGTRSTLVLCLLPFEKQFYDAHGVRCRVRRSSAGRSGAARDGEGADARGS